MLFIYSPCASRDQTCTLCSIRCFRLSSDLTCPRWLPLANAKCVWAHFGRRRDPQKWRGGTAKIPLQFFLPFREVISSTCLGQLFSIAIAWPIIYKSNGPLSSLIDYLTNWTLGLVFRLPIDNM